MDGGRSTRGRVPNAPSRILDIPLHRKHKCRDGGRARVTDAKAATVRRHGADEGGMERDRLTICVREEMTSPIMDVKEVAMSLSQQSQCRGRSEAD